MDDRLRGRNQLDAALGESTGSPMHVGVGEDGDQAGQILMVAKADWKRARFPACVFRGAPQGR
jgi:hypothetical protein